MFRLLSAVIILAWLALSRGGHAQEAAAAAAPSAVFSLRDARALQGREENSLVTRQMVDALVMAATRRADVGSAWRSLVTPADRVGIKVSCVGGRYFSTHRGVVDAIVAGLNQAGVPSSHIVVWDRDAERLETAGFVSRRGGYVVRSIEAPAGYDREAPLAAPVLGRLIWGDVQFAERQPKGMGAYKTRGDPLSSTSFAASILSRDVTKVINVPVFCDESGCALAGALYNMTIPNVDNWRRFVQSDGSGADSIPSIYADEKIGPKVVLHILDALVAQYAGGPQGNLNYAFAHHTLYASKDPVALDAVMLRQMEPWRALARLPAIAERANWLKTAQDMGLGNFEPGDIRLEELPPLP